MLEIPGIDAEKVELYGRSFLKLIRDFQQSYESMMQRQEDRIQDPNHMNVIDISDDEDMGSNDLDDLDDDDFAKERSSYFPSRDVEAFNAQCLLHLHRRNSLSTDKIFSIPDAASTERAYGVSLATCTSTH